jgi:cell division protein FtsB
MHTSPPTSVPTTTDPLPSATPSPGDADRSPSDPPIRTPLLHRVLLTLLPATLLVGVVVSAIWGDSGLLARRALQSRLHEANARVAELDRDNQRILHLLSSMDRDPLVLERMVADELGWAREGATVYRFEPPPDAPDAE